MADPEVHLPAAQPLKWNRNLEWMPAIKRYWTKANPEYCDGEGAKSFGTLLRRAQVALDRLSAILEDALVYIFSHWQFIQAIQSLVVDSDLTARKRVRKFWGKGSPAISNAELVKLAFEDGVWGHLPAQGAHAG